jgi:hypothetical protein
VVFKIARLALGALVHHHYGCFVCVMLPLTVSSNSQLLCPDSFKTEMGEAFSAKFKPVVVVYTVP